MVAAGTIGKQSRLPVVLALGTTQTIAWASSYYLPAILADPMARDLGVSPTWIFGAVSISLILSALIGPKVGRTIDILGGRGVLALSNIVFAAGLCVLCIAHTKAVLALGWLAMGAGMGLGLYDSAFATLGRLYNTEARRSITGITLMAGFASTIGWPLTAWGAETFGWRETCLGWAAVHLFFALPLNLLGIPQASRIQQTVEHHAKPHIPMDKDMWLLAFAFACGWIVSTGMAAHLPRIIEGMGATTAQAIGASALVGPAQVFARLVETSLLARYHPLISARLSTVAHPIGAILTLIASGGAVFGLFASFHGAGNGILTIARGTVPLAVFGPENYGYRLGLIGAPARLAQAAAPLLFGILIDRLGSGVLFVSSGLCLAALLALLFVKATHALEEIN